MVTGGSSGIGRAISEKCCKQGLNLIIVAVKDKLLEDATTELKKSYPALQIIAVGVDLSGNFMQDVAAATAGKTIQVLFMNAGFMKTGFYTETPFGAWRANNAVNVGAHIELTHEYVGRLQRANKKGCVLFTSSPAFMLPCPLTIMYGATKAFVTEFAVGLAAEVRSSGIDVCAVLPSPVQSNFYNGAHKIDEISFFQGTAKGPEVLVDRMFATVGRLVMCNQGYYPASVALLLKFCDWTMMVEIIARIIHMTGSFKQIKSGKVEIIPGSGGAKKAD